MTNEEEEQEMLEQAQSAVMPDWYLQALVRIVNGSEIEFPITLFVNGSLVSGQLVSGHRYFGDGLGTALKQFFNNDESEGTKSAIKHLTAAKDVYLEDKSKEVATKEGEEVPYKRPPQFIHLREARVFVAGQKPIPEEGSWWRGRLSSVDGFHFGSLRASD